MMTLIVVLAFLMVAFIGFLRYDIHKHKYAQPKKDDSQSLLPDSFGHADQKAHSDHSEDK